MTIPRDIDEVLLTTRAVRRRLDLERPVPRELIEECLTLALQAPSSTNTQDWRFVVVTDAATRAGLAELYRRAANDDSYLSQHLNEVPVHLVPCVVGRTDSSVALQAAQWGSILPATWSFMLAARARGLGTVLTTWHLDYEREAADLLGIPYDAVMQAALVPVAFTKGTDFRAGPRKPLGEVVHWERW
jgi:nitroreductase